MAVTTKWILSYEGSDAFSRTVWEGVRDSQGKRDFRYPSPPFNEMKGSLALTPFELGLDSREDALRFCATLLRAWKMENVDGYMLTAHLSEKSDKGYEPVVAMFDSVDTESPETANSSLRRINYMTWPV